MKTLLMITGLLAAMIFAAFALARPSYAAPACDTVERLVASIDPQFDRTPVFLGVEARGGYVAVYERPDGTWVLIGVGGNGMACIVAYGLHGVVIVPGEAG